MKLPSKVLGLKAAIYIPLTLIIVAGVAYFASARYYFPKRGWKVISGCVTAGDKEVNYRFYAKSDWESVTKEMGCGKTYTDAQSWGENDVEYEGSVSDYTQVTILAYEGKPSTYDTNASEYFAVPDKDGYYIELGRITISPNINEMNITDAQWEYIKKSFKINKL
jgi:hypothetical protein